MTPSSQYNLSFSPNGDYIVVAVPSEDDTSSELHFYRTKMNDTSNYDPNPV